MRSNEKDGLPVAWEQLGVDNRIKVVEEHYPEGEPAFNPFSVVPYMLKDAIRSYVLGFRVASHLSSMATIEKLLAEETGEDYWREISSAAEEMGLIKDPDRFENQLRDAYNSDKHYRGPSDENHVSERMKRIAERKGVEGGYINIYVFLEYEAEDALKELLQLLPELDCVEIGGEPKPFEATPWR